MRAVNCFLTFLVATAVTTHASDYTCATCHAQQAASQPTTAMGRALIAPGANSPLTAHSSLTFSRGRFHYRIETKKDSSILTVSDGDHSLSTPIEWIFGAGSQTYLLRRDGIFIESMVSFYPELGGLDVTMGDQRLDPQTLEQALGRKLTETEASSCFNCHSTHALNGHKLDLAAMKPGLDCERCHVSAAGHLASLLPGSHAQGNSRIVPVKLSTLTTESLSNFCGQCHRSWETVVRNNWKGEINVRFQPYRLANSKCFDGADPRISCIACHNPHQDLVTSDNTYDAKCIACHPTSGVKACRVGQTGCIGCHMPKVPLPGGHQTFTDHNIRVVRAGDPYPN